MTRISLRVDGDNQCHSSNAATLNFGGSISQRQDKLGEEPSRAFEEAAVRFLHISEGQRDYKTKVRHVRYWRDVFAGHPVSSLTTERIMDALPTYQVHKHKGPQKLAPATKNRYLSTIQRILSLCEEWRWIHKAPKLRPYA